MTTHMTEKASQSAGDPILDIDELRKEIDRLDAEILAAIKRRTEVSREIGKARMASGGPRLVHSREMKVLERYSELGQEGHTRHVAAAPGPRQIGTLIGPDPGGDRDEGGIR